MSIWYEIKDKEDIQLSDDGKSLQINFDGNDDGNIWVEVPLELIDQLRQPDISGYWKILDKNGIEMPDDWTTSPRTYEKVKRLLDRLNSNGEYRPYTMVKK